MVKKSNKKITAPPWERWDKRYLWHPFTQQYEWERNPILIIKSGKGAYLTDIHGKRYLDGVSSLWVNLFGHRHPVLDRAFRSQLRRIAHSTFLGLSHTPAIELGRALAQCSPRGLVRSFYSDNGATAVEIALKMAFQYWIEKGPKINKSPRTEFLAVKGSYHGDTLGSVSVGGIGSFHSKFKPLLFKSHFAMSPHCAPCPYNKNKVVNRFRLGEKIKHIPKPGEERAETGCHWECLSDVERLLKKRAKKIAAGILEPVVQGAGGMIVLPPGYVAGFHRLLKKFKVLFIADEVATGLGRTGTLFAVEQENVSPDILCLAKSLTAGYSPFAATLTKEFIYRAFYAPLAKQKTFFHGHSYTAHPLGAAVALANLRLIKKTKLLEKSRHLAHLMRDELRAFAGHPSIGSIRQAGLMAGIELVENKKRTLRSPNRGRAFHVCRRLLSLGIWLRPLGQTLVLMPPPILSPRDLHRLFKRLRSVILYEGKT